MPLRLFKNVTEPSIYKKFCTQLTTASQIRIYDKGKPEGKFKEDLYELHFTKKYKRKFRHFALEYFGTFTSVEKMQNVCSQRLAVNRSMVVPPTGRVNTMRPSTVYVVQ